MNNTHSSRARSTVLPLVLTALFAALTAIGAFLRIPAGEISFTLQVFFTSMAGILLGPWWGAASQVVYVLLGLIGLPIFTEGGGLMYLAKPSCGFLLGLPLMAMVIGLLTRDLKASTLRGHAVRGMLRIALACVAGLAVLYLIGLPYMYFVLAGKWSIQKTIVSGCLIFLPFDALKIVVTTLLCVRLLPVLRRDCAKKSFFARECLQEDLSCDKIRLSKDLPGRIFALQFGKQSGGKIRKGLFDKPKI